MRGLVWAIVLVGLVPACLLSGCAEEDDKMANENVLELQIGGDHESLSTALRRPLPGAKKIATAKRVDAVPPKSDRPKPDDPKPEPPRTEPRKAEPPRPRAEFHIVTLAKGQTLYGLCRTHLGSGGRWKEVAALNGWSEARAGKLRAGQKVKLPVK